MPMTQVVDKKVKLNLRGVDSNAFSIMGAFSKAAHKAKWTEEEINKVLNEATSGEYTHLLATIQAHCE